MTGKLLDTTVLIDLSRGDADAADFIDAARVSGTPLFISVISALASDNARHFKMIPGLAVERPY